jgi:ribosome-interacting GTPase 1
MVNYQNGKIYRIVSNRDDEVFYVGSTTKKYLSQRMDSHRGSYKCWKNGKDYKVRVYDLFEKYGVENCRIELLQLFPCNSKDELTKKEGEYIRILNCVNKVKPNRTPQEKKTYHQIYYKNNKIYKEPNHNKKLDNHINYMCQCGSIIRIYGKKEHEQTKKHIEFVQSQSI